MQKFTIADVMTLARGTKISDLDRISNGLYTYTFDGYVFAVPGSTIPLAVVGRGVIALAYISCIDMDESGHTDISFAIKQISEIEQSAYNKLLNVNVEDRDGDSDVNIPGAVDLSARPKSENGPRRSDRYSLPIYGNRGR